VVLEKNPDLYSLFCKNPDFFFLLGKYHRAALP
jgi:hypothetical protein